MKVAALHLFNFLDYAQMRGVTPQRVLTPLQLNNLDKQDINQLIEEAEIYKALNWVQDELKDDLWGIKAGNFLTLKLLGLIYQISLQVTTIEEAFHYLQSYLETTLPLVKMKTTTTAEQITVLMQIENEDKKINRIILENVLTIISREITLMVTGEFSFSLTSPYYTTSYPSHWKKEDYFTISFAPVLLKAALRKRPVEQLDLLLPEYLKLIETLKALDQSFSNKVKVTMLAMSDPHLPDITAVSDALYLTPRSLQRKLERENSSFREILLDLKKQICSFLLRHKEYSITSMSYVLGYAEPAAFIHSFKKWFGDSPERVRQNLRNSST
ncbi:helix-turn-helix transcriptional regulator [Adhaeribacter radiodurans]|uniref:Helix-turn-helix transcriptional regulator n=1 Tax=Adhaeribacter radiodurans TaxID=2745197 RepID=A0A7L7L963_9BACT|nr:helix-turn-helix transcriptional regulator [Adhaeribacter radiodurans]QMU29357.1 helix-turn-helix transcriptional regulator [Adhaeribacter radiodurans]